MIIPKSVTYFKENKTVMYKNGEEVRAGFSEEVSWKWKVDGKESGPEDGLEIIPSGQIQRLLFFLNRNGNSIRKTVEYMCFCCLVRYFSYSNFTVQLCLTHKVRVNFLFVCRPRRLYLFRECGCWQLWCGRHLALDLELSFRLCFKDFFPWNYCWQYKEESLGINNT